MTDPGQATDNSAVYPLSGLPEGTRATVVGLPSGRRAYGRLVNMGLKIGSEVQVVRNSIGGGPVLVATGLIRLAIGRGMAARILVSIGADEAG